MKTIHDTPEFRIECQITFHPITGKTVEIFQIMPQAQHPRTQRIACLTLPQASFNQLAELLTDSANHDHVQYGNADAEKLDPSVQFVRAREEL
jgi:hypothetical protein